MPNTVSELGPVKFNIAAFLSFQVFRFSIKTLNMRWKVCLDVLYFVFVPLSMKMRDVLFVSVDPRNNFNFVFWKIARVHIFGDGDEMFD